MKRSHDLRHGAHDNHGIPMPDGSACIATPRQPSGEDFLRLLFSLRGYRLMRIRHHTGGLSPREHIGGTGSRVLRAYRLGLWRQFCAAGPRASLSCLVSML
jgi:hypothetical protein